MKKFFSIGAIGIALEYNPELYNILLDSALETFAVAPFEVPDILVHLDTTSLFPQLNSYRKIFTTSPVGAWLILEDIRKSHYLISLHDGKQTNPPHTILKANRKFTDFIAFSKPPEDNTLLPLGYPLDELMVSGHININKIGIILHSACVSIQGKGVLFSGVSGSGKSTISEIWQKDREAEVLTDERVIIREFHDDLWAFGTPWHGTAKIHKNMGAPIEKIFFIKHGKENKAIPVSKRDATNRLMVRCFPTFWNRRGMQFTLDFCSIIAHKKKCYELEFVNDLSIIEYLKNLENFS
jgi:hypothetical protein